MSYRIGLNRFEGDDLESAADQLAKVFRITKAEASRIVIGLSDGNAWQFQQITSTEQSQMAENFLSSKGFEVELHPVAEDMAQDDAEPAEEEPANTGNKGIMGKIWLELNKKR